MILDVFVSGARKGWSIATHSTIPNLVMAFVAIRALELTGLLKLVGDLCGPLMAPFGLPGEAATVLLAAWLSMGGGVGVAVSLFDSHALNGNHLTILAPAIFLMGAQLQYIGRLLGVIGTRARIIPIMLLIAVLNAAGGMLLMRLLAVS